MAEKKLPKYISIVKGKYRYSRRWTRPDGISEMLFSRLSVTYAEAEFSWEHKKLEREAGFIGAKIRSFDDRPIAALLYAFAALPKATGKKKSGQWVRTNTTKNRLEAARALERNLDSKITPKLFNVLHAKALRLRLETSGREDNQPYAHGSVHRYMLQLRASFDWAYDSKPRQLQRNNLRSELLSEAERAELFNLRQSDAPEVIVKYDRAEIDRICAPDYEYFNQYNRGGLKKSDDSSYFRAQNKLFIRTLFETGIRLGEGLGLLWRDIQWGDKEKNIPTRFTINQQYDGNDRKGGFVKERYVSHWMDGFSFPKNDRWGPLKTRESYRSIPIPWPLHDLLAAHFDHHVFNASSIAWLGDQPVFRGRDGQPLTYNTIHGFLKRRCVHQLSMNYRAVHALRRGYASEKLVEGKMDPVVIRELLGHSPDTDVIWKYVDRRSRGMQDRIDAETMATAPTAAFDMAL